MHRTTLANARLSLWTTSLFLMICSCALPSCTTGNGGKTKDDATDEIVGRPPTSDDDPFANKALPADAIPASTSGTVGEPGRDPDRNPDNPPTEDTAPAVAREAEPTEKPENVEDERGYRCFSCVRICPDSDPTPDCSNTPENIICGWGASDVEPDAKRLARAECDATLDLARGMPRYSRIDGACPKATCR